MKPFSALAAAAVFILMIAEPVRAAQCPSWTQEQEELLIKAAYLAAPHDWSYTLAAMCWQESIHRDQIIREKPNDADGGSWGVCHMRVTTALYIVGWEDNDETREVMSDLLVRCDTCALELALTYFMRHHAHLGWRDGIARYNGSGEAAEIHADRVIRKVRILQGCAPWLEGNK